MVGTLKSRPGRNEQGFTLIELLVVILIIGILAAIALPTFLDQQRKAQDVEAKHAVRIALTAMLTCFADKGTYAGCDATELKSIEPSLNSANNLQAPVSGWGYRPLAADSFSVAVYSKSSANTRYVMLIEPGGTTIDRWCLPAGGGCPSNNHW